jgi:hypothetical protein
MLAQFFLNKMSDQTWGQKKVKRLVIWDGGSRKDDDTIKQSYELIFPLQTSV